ncbi:MAG: FHA domain-containing protein [Chloroflexi bacterium]|nr:FHA domain-containing protein [Chloroflexota bacterium]
MDLGSANGTLLDDVPLPPRKAITITPGQTIKIAGFQFEVRVYQKGEAAETGKIVLHPEMEVLPGALPVVSADKTMLGSFMFNAPEKPPARKYFLIYSDKEQPHQSLPLTDGEFVIGREPGCEVQIKSMGISRQHALLTVEGDKFLVTDLKSTNGVIVNGQKIEPEKPHQVEIDKPFIIHEVTFMISAQVQAQVSDKGALSGLGTQFVAAQAEEAAVLSIVQKDATRLSMLADIRFLDLSGQERVTIGRSEKNTVQFDHPAVSRYHAVLERMGKRFRVLDLQSANGVYVNGALIKGESWLKAGDRVKIGPYAFIFSGAGIQMEAETGYSIDAIHINKWVSKSLNLLKDINLSIGGNEFVALVGMSGSGKTTFLDTLNGFRPATEGQVFINNTNLYENYDMFRDEIGYVPQRDIVHMELTPNMALDYAARLRLPADTSLEERRAVVEQTLKDLGLWERKDIPISRLSGGQLKRVSIGVELLTRPRLFFLDEPTSGLDPGTEYEMMRLLRRLADQGRTIIIVTHTTKNVMLCDKVIILGTGGYLVFFGAPEDALAHFDAYRTPRERLEKEMEFDEIYRLLTDRERGTPQEWAERFKASKYCKPVKGELEATPQAEAAKPRKAKAAAPSQKQVQRTSAIKQLLILSARNLKILFQDKVSLMLMLALAPVLGLMNFIWGRDIFDEVNGSMNNVMGMWFMTAIVALLVGAMTSVREVVKEADIYKRERAVGLKIFPYVFSKLWMGFVMSFYQGGVILLIVIMLVHPPISSPSIYGEFFITIVLGILTGYLLGLVISAAVPNQNAALIALIAVIVPQFLYTGVLIPLEEVPLGEPVSYITPARWTFEAFVVSTGMSDTLVQDECWALPKEQRSALTEEQKNQPGCPCMGTYLFQECPGIPGLFSQEYYDDVAKLALSQPEPQEPVQPGRLPTPTSLPTPTRLPTPTPYPAPTPLPTPILLYQLDQYRDDSVAQNEEYFETRSDQMSAYYDASQEQFSNYLENQKQAMEAYSDASEQQFDDYSSEIDQYGNDLADWQRSRQKAVGAAENILSTIMSRYGPSFYGTPGQRWIILGIQIAVMFFAILGLQKRKDTL